MQKLLSIKFILIGMSSIIGVLLLPFYYKFIWLPALGNIPQPQTVDILAFWGAVFGGIITLFGVIFTIRSSYSQIERTLQIQAMERFLDSFPKKIENINHLKGKLDSLIKELSKMKKESIIKSLQIGVIPGYDNKVVERLTEEAEKNLAQLAREIETGKADTSFILIPLLMDLLKSIDYIEVVSSIDAYTYTKTKEIKNGIWKIRNALVGHAWSIDNDNIDKELDNISRYIQKYIHELEGHKNLLGENYLDYEKKLYPQA